jgi:heat shock protein HtpX
VTHLFIVNPLFGERMDNLFATHPATETRLAALLAMADSPTAGGARPSSVPRVGGATHPAGPVGPGGEAKRRHRLPFLLLLCR